MDSGHHMSLTCLECVSLLCLFLLPFAARAQNLSLCFLAFGFNVIGFKYHLCMDVIKVVLCCST